MFINFLLFIPILSKIFNKIDINEYTYDIKYNLTKNENNILKKINGFYGLIGPNLKYDKIDKLHDLLIGDGVIQGFFFKNSKITYIRKFIDTKKVLFEKKNGKVINSFNNYIFLYILNELNIMKNMIGLSNTAFLNIENKIYTLYELDNPYLIDINFQNNDIKTIKKIKIKNIDKISGHTKFINNIETIEYNLFKKYINYYQLSKNFEIISEKKFKMNHIPLIHDFLVTDRKFILFDFPLKINIFNILNNKLPIELQKYNTYIYVYDKKRNIIENYKLEDSIYIFHFSECIEDNNFIKIYASIYEKMDFIDLNIKGKYRLILINKKNKKVSIIKNNELEKYNLDFPVKYKKFIILKNIENNIINGFVICKKLSIFKKIILKNRFIKGEHVIIDIDKNPYILCVSSEIDNKKSFITLININTDKIIEIPFYEDLNLGFHSTFIFDN